jgi:hypothetical protein
MNPVIPAVLGLGGGVAIGYIAASSGTKLPKITLSSYQVTIGQTYTITYENFPANAQLVAPQSLYPPAIVNLGTTDAQGKLAVGSTAVGPAGNYYLIAWDAITGQHAAVVMLVVT